MIPIFLKIIGLIIVSKSFTFFNFESSIMKAFTKIVIVICWTMILKLYLQGIGEHSALLEMFMISGLLLILFPMLCQFE